jgi:hypothetical protein
MPPRAPRPPRPPRPEQPDYLTRAEANALASELDRRGDSIASGRIRQNVAEAMRVAGVRAAMIYAYARTGLLVTGSMQSAFSSEQLQAWRAAVREYRKA